MKKYVFVLILLAFQSSAAVSCFKTATGTTYCSGEDRSGNKIGTESTTTAAGTTYTSGKDSSGNVSRQCFTAATGTTYCE